MADCPACSGCPVAAIERRSGRAVCARCYLHAEDPTAYQPCPKLTTGEEP